MDDQNSELSGAGQGAEDLELTPEVESSVDDTTSKESSSDPLDDIKDEVVRAQAKKDRAIARRLEKKPEEKKPEPASEFLTKADFQKANEKKAIRQATADPEVKANWDKIVSFYTPRRGRETPEDIAEDIQDAIILFKARNPVVEKDNSALELTTSPVVKSGGGVVDKGTPKPKEPPNFKLPVPVKDWYPKKT